MKKFLIILSILAAIAPVNLFAANTLQGRVVGVSDGDSVTLLDAEQRPSKIRLAGIDAPEKAQAFGQKAKESLSELIYLKAVEVEWSKQDRYGRIVGKIRRDGMDISLEQVRRGMAWHYKQYQMEQPEEDRLAYTQAEGQARDKRLGLWQDPHPTEPSIFRRKK
jgi:endonuclease YncB( thermonuclease family)